MPSDTYVRLYTNQNSLELIRNLLHGTVHKCDLQWVNQMNRERERKDREPVDKQSVWATWAYRVYGPYLTPPFKLKAEVEDLKH